MERTRELLAGRYELEDVIGRGGMGVVYRATDSLLGRVVAVKLLPDDRAGDPTLVTRFEREALAAAALNHPNIISVYDTGRDAGTHFIVMEYVQGDNLATLVRRRGRLPAPEAATLATQAAAAIAAAHRAGIVHRDIKPANIMVDPHGTVKVLDFGIARAATGTTLTQTALVMGSAPYLAPEVVRGERADERSDIYSLGCVIYELITGQPPFTAENPAAVLHQHTSRRPRALHELAPGTPAVLDRLVIGMLAKDPGRRPQSARELTEAIPAALADDTAPTAIMRPPSSEAPTAIADPPTAIADPPTAIADPPARRRRSGLVASIALAFAGVVALIVLAVALAGSPSPRHAKHGTGTRRVGHRHTGATTKPPATTTPTTATTPTTPTTTTTQTTPAPATVGQAAGALTSLATQDLQGGSIDQQAAQAVLGQLQGILNAYDNANAQNALNQLSNLTAQMQQLVTHGDITAAAVPGLSAAVSTLGTALGRAASTTTGQGSDQGQQPPAKQHKPHPPHPHH